jgi:hypothetical protein
MAKKRIGKPSAAERTVSVFEQAQAAPVAETVTHVEQVQVVAAGPAEVKADPASGTQSLPPAMHELVASSTFVQRVGDWVEYRTPCGGTCHIYSPGGT